MIYNVKKYEYVNQYYTAAQIESYCAGDNSKLDKLWHSAQPVEITIKDFIDQWEYGKYLINSPDGYIPVVDTIIKQKIKMYEITTELGKSLTCSYDHYLQGPSAEWIYAQNLSIGDKILTKDGIERITCVQELPGDTTYDIEVGHENHRYYTNGLSSHNSGKSLFLQNISLNLVKQGMNVIYITLELSEELCSMRMDSMLSEVQTKEIFRKIDEVEIRVKQAGKRSGLLHVKQLPQGSTCNDIKAYLKTYEIETQRKPDVLVVDYLDLLFPNNKKIDPSNLFVKDKFVTEELRGLMVERQMIGMTAAQLNRCLSTDTEVVSNGVKTKILEVNVGDWLDSSEGPVQILEKLPVIKQPVFKITTKSGKTVTCSAKHKFPTKSGLKSLESGLKIGDSLSVVINMYQLFKIDDEITSIEYIGVEDTVDINVSGNKLFYANEILTHNSSVQEQEHDHSHISGGISKIQTADNVISIFASAAMKERGQYQVQFLKTRSSSGVGSKVNLGFDPNTLQIFNSDDDSAAVVTSSATADVFADLRRKNSSAAKKADGDQKSTDSTKSIKDLSALTALVRR